MNAWNRITALSKIVALDGIRKHTLIGLVLLALLAETFGIFFIDFFGYDIGRVASDFFFSVMWLAGLLFLFFHAVQVIAWDEEQKIIFAILARPLSRTEYVIGTWLGLLILMLFLELLLGTIAWLSLLWIQSNVGEVYFLTLNGTGFIITLLGLLLTQTAVLSAIMLFSGLVRGGFPVLILSLAYYFICSGLPVVRESIQRQISMNNEGEGLAMILKALSFLFPDMNRMDYKGEVVNSLLSLDSSAIIFQIAFAIVYALLMIALACHAYSRRDIQ